MHFRGGGKNSITEEVTIKIQSKMNKQVQGKDRDCFPLYSLYCYLKIRLTGKLNKKDLHELYRCTLCNQCHYMGFNQSARERAVKKGLILPHVAEITQNIRKFGNSYGVDTSREENKQQGDNKWDKVETILFRGCTSRYKVPEILDAVANLLRYRGIEYATMANETCCGGLLFNLGDQTAGLETVRDNIEKFKAAGVKRIITVCPGCYDAFHVYYKGQYGFDPEIILAIDLLKGLTFTGEDFHIQDPCHARDKAFNVRTIVPSRRYIEESSCCGAGGGVIAHDKSLACTKAKKAMDKSSTKMVTYCPLCYLNMSSTEPDKVFDIYLLLDDLLFPNHHD